jgi:hypothetical protein
MYEEHPGHCGKLAESGVTLAGVVTACDLAPVAFLPTVFFPCAFADPPTTDNTMVDCQQCSPQERRQNIALLNFTLPGPGNAGVDGGQNQEYSNFTR